MKKFKNLYDLIETDSESYGATKKRVQDMITRDRIDGITELLAGILVALSNQGQEISEQTETLSDLQGLVGLMKLPVSTKFFKDVLYADKMVVDARMAFSPAQGFFELDYLGDGTPYRWTSGEKGRATVKGYVKRSSGRTITLCVVNSGLIKSAEVKVISTIVNGEQLDLVSDTPDVEIEPSDLVFYVGTLPALETDEPTLISINFPTWRPCDVDPESTDDRELGIAFVSLEIKSGENEDA